MTQEKNGSHLPKSESELLNDSFTTWLFAQSFEFVISAASLAQLPEAALPEVAFVGRSNVGKSSLINALTNQKKLAKISNTPGRTQQINFFRVAERLMLVDLPGYGYAQASQKAIKQWNQLIALYLQGRSTLRRVYLLIDARHGLKDNDLKFMDLLDSAAVSYQLVLTKMDKLRKSDASSRLLENQSQSIKTRPAAHPDILITSSETKEGIDTLRKSISPLAIGG